MIVVDSSTLVERLLGNQRIIQVVSREMAVEGQTTLCAPDLIQLEVMSAIRRLERLKIVTPARAADILARLRRARVALYPHGGLQQRVWELRHNLSIYDATYVALAELLEGSLLITSDRGMADGATSVSGALRVLYLQAQPD